MENFQIHTEFIIGLRKEMDKNVAFYIKNVSLINFFELKATRPQGHNGSFNNYVDIDFPLFDHPLTTFK